MTLPCGKQEIHNLCPCTVLLDPKREIVCMAVGEAILDPNLTAESSLAQKREAVWQRMDAIGEPVVSRMRSIAIAAIYDCLEERDCEERINNAYTEPKSE